MGSGHASLPGKSVNTLSMIWPRIPGIKHGAGTDDEICPSLLYHSGMHLITSDIHGSAEGVKLLQEAAAHFGTSATISAGDQNPDPSASSFYSSLISVRGNCDRYYEYDGIVFPPQTRELRLYGHDVIITHGDRLSPGDFHLKEGDIFISGHTHVPELIERNGIYFCNPGSPSRSRSSAGPTAALLSDEGLFLFSLLDFGILKAISFSR